MGPLAGPFVLAVKVWLLCRSNWKFRASRQFVWACCVRKSAFSGCGLSGCWPRQYIHGCKLGLQASKQVELSCEKVLKTSLQFSPETTHKRANAAVPPHLGTCWQGQAQIVRDKEYQKNGAFFRLDFVDSICPQRGALQSPTPGTTSMFGFRYQIYKALHVKRV